MSQVFISPHPLVAHKLAKLRSVKKEPKKFRELIREIAGLLYQAFAHEQIKEKLKEKSLPPASPPKKMRSEKFSREKVQTYISENKLEELIALAEEDDRVIPELARMLYTPDEHLRWKIIKF